MESLNTPNLAVNILRGGGYTEVTSRKLNDFIEGVERYQQTGEPYFTLLNTPDEMKALVEIIGAGRLKREQIRNCQTSTRSIGQQQDWRLSDELLTGSQREASPLELLKTRVKWFENNRDSLTRFDTFFLFKLDWEKPMDAALVLGFRYEPEPLSCEHCRIDRDLDVDAECYCPVGFDDPFASNGESFAVVIEVDASKPLRNDFSLTAAKRHEAQCS